MQIIFQGNPQQVNVTEVSHNQVANVTIGSSEAKQQPSAPPQEAEETPCEIVPEAQTTAAEEATAKPRKLSDKEKNAMHLLYGAGLLNKSYQFHTKEEASQNKKLRFLTTGKRVLLAKTLGNLSGSPEYVQYFCKDFWQMPANRQTLSSALYDLTKEHPDQAQAFQQEIDEILRPLNKRDR